MSDAVGGDEAGDAFRALKAHAEALERQLRDVEAASLQQLRQSELKAEAMRAGIVDIDGLRLLDPAHATSSQGEAFDAVEVIGRLRRDKPWLFGSASSSSSLAAPEARPTRRRLATDMTVEEWRAARADLLRRR